MCYKEQGHVTRMKASKMKVLVEYHEKTVSFLTLCISEVIGGIQEQAMLTKALSFINLF